MNIGVLGIGAIGTVISLSLKTDNVIYYYNRSPKTTLKLQFQNYTTQKSISLNTPSNIPLDWLIICLKEYHYKNASILLKKLINKNTKVAVIRNGINLKDSILQYTDSKNIIECIIDCPTQIENRLFIQLKKGIITLDKKNTSLNFLSLFHTKNLNFQFSKDFKTDSWMKLIESSAIGSILCLSNRTAIIFKDTSILNLYTKIIEEGIQVANADGAQIPPDFTLHLTEKARTLPSKKGSSMLTDKLNGNPIEINAKNGIISSLGKKLGIYTPINNLITFLLKNINT
ncbi:ketopantoate reductase C-terminal domain-containing protein [uncultured Tenacibaculum sp.]|uniref:ketopantoate reductase C-terminal domain-containing protein n=1 Tax=uncultured Tenacibaculum sp. TaxID=174713 RepID=UPI00260340DA|nr:ketopantoate reductase C-terminal domain-containing protein [uncultured Tenacibaculum sp.]